MSVDEGEKLETKLRGVVSFQLVG